MGESTYPSEPNTQREIHEEGGVMGLGKNWLAGYINWTILDCINWTILDYIEPVPATAAVLRQIKNPDLNLNTC